MAVPIALWLGSRRSGSPTARVLAYPAMGACILAILLTQSRGAAAAALVGALAWFVLVPLRLRSLPVLLVPLAGAVAVGAWALSKDPFTKTLQPLSAKESVAGDFGGLVFLMLLLLVLVGAAVEAGAARRVPSARARRRIGIAAVAVACLVPLAGFTSVAFSERGIGERIDELTSETEVAPEEGGGRVFAASSSRGKYWREAFRVFDARPLEGVGAGRVRRRPAPPPHRRLRHAPRARVDPADDGRPRPARPRAHDAAVPGLGRGGAERHRPAASQARAARRATSLRRAATGTPGGSRSSRCCSCRSRSGSSRCSTGPGSSRANAVMALLAAGFVAGRGPLGERAARALDAVQLAAVAAARRGGASRRCATAAAHGLGDLAAGGLRRGHERRARARRRAQVRRRRSRGRTTPRTSTRLPPIRCSCARRSTPRRTAGRTRGRASSER